MSTTLDGQQPDSGHPFSVWVRTVGTKCHRPVDCKWQECILVLGAGDSRSRPQFIYHVERPISLHRLLSVSLCARSDTQTPWNPAAQSTSLTHEDFAFILKASKGPCLLLLPQGWGWTQELDFQVYSHSEHSISCSLCEAMCPALPQEDHPWNYYKFGFSFYALSVWKTLKYLFLHLPLIVRFLDMKEYCVIYFPSPLHFQLNIRFVSIL